MSQIVGTVELDYSRNPRKPKQCLCCPSFPSHVYSEGFKLDPFETYFPDYFTRDLDHWLRSQFDFKSLEGRRIKITAELLDA